MRHVLVVNSDRMEALDRLELRRPVTISAIVKPKYEYLYAGRAATRCVTDVADTAQVLAAAVELTREHGPVDAVVAPLERSIIPAAFLRSYLQIPGMQLDVALGFANKLVMKTRLRQAGIPVASFAPVGSAREITVVADHLGWPVILKPAVGAGSQHTRRFASPAELDAALGAGEGAAIDALPVPLLVEAEVTMSGELHCEGVVSDGRVVALSASRYFVPMFVGFGTFNGSVTLPAGDPVRDELATLHRRVVEALGLVHGVTHMEAYETPGGLVVGEITCRPGGGGTTNVAMTATGRDMWDDFVATSLGLPVAPGTMAGVPGQALGWCGLPARNGTVVALTDPGVLAAVPGVDRVEMFYQVGDVIEEKPTSVFNAGIAYLSAADPQALLRAVDEVQARYALTVG